MANLKWTQGGILSATQLNKISSSISFEDQELTAQQQKQARENIGAAALSDIEGVFWVKYGVTTKQEIMSALSAKKLPIIEYEYTDFYDYLILTHWNWSYIIFSSPILSSSGEFRRAVLNRDTGEWTISLLSTLPDPPKTAENYTLKVTVSNNRPSYSWVAVE